MRQHQGVDMALMHLGTAWGLWSGSSNQSPGAICTILQRAPSEAPSPSKPGQRGEQRPCALPGDTQKEAIQRGLSKRREKYTQISEGSAMSFKEE